MNNLNSHANFESSPIASPMASNLNTSRPMMGGRRKRNRKMHKKGGMDPNTPEKDRKSQVMPVDENNQMVKPKNLFSNDTEHVMDVKNDQISIDIANDEDYKDLENIPDETKMVEDEDEYKVTDRDIDILDKLESGVDIESRGGSRRRKRRTRRNKTKKLYKKTKKSKRKGSNKKTRKLRRSSKK